MQISDEFRTILTPIFQEEVSNAGGKYPLARIRARVLQSAPHLSGPALDETIEDMALDDMMERAATHRPH